MITYSASKPPSACLWFRGISSRDHCTLCVHDGLRRPQALGAVLSYSQGKLTTLSCCLCHIWFSDENSNQSSVSDVYQLKVDSSTNSSPSPQQSESLSPAHTSDFRTDDSQPPTLGQEILEGESRLTQDEHLGRALPLAFDIFLLYSERLWKVLQSLAASRHLLTVWAIGGMVVFSLFTERRNKQTT